MNIKTLGKILLIALCLFIAGPQLAVGFELVALIDLFGLELFLLSFLGPLWFYWFRLEMWLGKIDKFFFIPTLEQLRQCPSLIAHAVPGYMPALLGFASITVLVS